MRDLDSPFPPGPTGPFEEPEVPGPRVVLRPEQAQAVATLAERGTVRVEDRGASWVYVTVFDSEGKTLEERLVPPDGGERPA